MKKLLPIAIACLFTINASAQFSLAAEGAHVLRKAAAGRQQSLTRLHYSIDTLHYNGQLVVKQRYDDRDLMGALGNNTLENNVILTVQKLQDQLNKLNKYMMERQELTFINVAKDYIDRIKNDKPGFNTSLYESEYRFYRSYSDTFGNGERERRNAEYAAQKKATEDYIAEQKYKQWQADSAEAVRQEMARISDSIYEIQAAKEQKLFEAKVKKKYGTKYGKAIIEHRVLLGMSKEMCELSWGTDHHTTQKATKTGVTETWTYGYKNYIVFNNGIATTVSE